MNKYKFEDIALYINDKRKPVPEDSKLYVGLEHLDSGSLKVRRWGSNVTLKGEKLIMHKGDLLFGRRNTYLRRASIAPHDGLFSAHGMIFRPKEEVIDKDFFPFFISSKYFMDEAIRISVGSLSPTVNWSQLRELEFYLPDIKTQKKYAKFLHKSEELKNSYEDIKSCLDEVFSANFVNKFGNTLEKSDKYESIKLSDIFIKPFSGEWGKDDKDGNGTPVLRTTNFTDFGYIDYKDVVTRDVDIKKAQNKYIKNGDILIEKSGGSTNKPVGRVVFYDGEDDIYLNNNFTAVLRLKKELDLEPIYVFNFIFTNYWLNGTKKYESQTTGIHNLNLRDYLDNTYIPLASIEDQLFYVNLYKKELELKEKYSLLIDCINTCQISILNNLFMKDGEENV